MLTQILRSRSASGKQSLFVHLKDLWDTGDDQLSLRYLEMEIRKGLVGMLGHVDAEEMIIVFPTAIIPNPVQ